MKDLLDWRENFDSEADNFRGQEWYDSHYVETVLRLELDRLDAQQGPWPTPNQNTLVLLCGTSPEPLLLATARVRPKRVLLVGSDSEDGKEALDEVENALTGVKGGFPQRFNLTELEPERSKPIDASNPALAYRTLVDEILRPLLETEEPESVLVDVTGGKKTMVAAAFLAASELSLRTQYVDFDKYHPKARLPFPGGAYVRLLDDPARVFRLRDEQAAKAAFDGERFAEAADILERILGDLRALGEGYVDPARLDLLELRLAYARASKEWSDARYAAALQFFETNPLASNGAAAPHAVALLGPFTDRAKLPAHSEKAVVYFADELWRHRRALLRGADPRIPFLRASAAMEVLLAAVLYHLRGSITRSSAKAECAEPECPKRGTIPKPAAAPVSMKDWKPEALSRDLMAKAMSDLASTGRCKMRTDTYELAPSPPVPFAKVLDGEGKESVKWRRLRNECTHGWAHVEANDALEFVGTESTPGIIGAIADECLTALGQPADLLDSKHYTPRTWDSFGP